MIVVNDTCAILMLVRICPDMFRDARFGCVMLQEAYAEYARSSRFKKQYPWREDFRKCLKSLPKSDLAEHGYDSVLGYVSAAAADVVDPVTQKKYADELSPTDLKMIAASYSLDAELCSGDGALSRYAANDWERQVISPLALVNRWLSQKLLAWDDEKLRILEDWVRAERPQPKKDIVAFERLTGRRYPKATA